jgi:hypothetical protein
MQNMQRPTPFFSYLWSFIRATRSFHTNAGGRGGNCHGKAANSIVFQALFFVLGQASSFLS